MPYTHIQVLYSYPCCPNAPWPYVRIDFTLERKTFYYMQFYLVPTVILTLMSFGAFFMSPDVSSPTLMQRAAAHARTHMRSTACTCV